MQRSLTIAVFLTLSINLFSQSLPDSVFSETEVILETSTGKIYGTLTIPKDVSNSPVALIIAGSGPTDRDGNSLAGIHTNAYKMLAASLAGEGISSLRFDKRGIGQSKIEAFNESDLRFETYINDVVDWISMLKSDKRFSGVVVIGHSEGSLIGMIASGQTDVSGFVSIAGAGSSADKILEDQLKTRLPPSFLTESNKILDSLRAGKTVTNVNPNLAALYRPSVQPYLISWMKYDPAVEIAKLKIPVLIIQGTTDVQVTVNEAQLLAAAKPDGKLVIIENMNHVLKESGADFQANMATYVNPGLPLKEGLVDVIVQFVKAEN